MSDGRAMVTGSRFWDDVWAVKSALDREVEAAQRAGYAEFMLRHGACYPPPGDNGNRPWRSADYLAHLWFAKYGLQLPLPFMVEQEFFAEWGAACRPACQQRTRRGRHTDHRITRADGSTYCPAAGKYRNTAMALEDPRATKGVAFHRDNSGGTGHCIRTMRELSIPVEVIPYAPGRPLPPRLEVAPT